MRKPGEGCRHILSIEYASCRHTSTLHVPLHAKSAAKMSSSAYRRLRHRNSQMKKMYALLDPIILKSPIRHTTNCTASPDRALKPSDMEHEIIPKPTERHTINEETASAPSWIQQRAPQNLDLPYFTELVYCDIDNIF